MFERVYDANQMAGHFLGGLTAGLATIAATRNYLYCAASVYAGMVLFGSIGKLVDKRALAQLENEREYWIQKSENIRVDFANGDYEIPLCLKQRYVFRDEEHQSVLVVNNIPQGLWTNSIIIRSNITYTEHINDLVREYDNVTCMPMPGALYLTFDYPTGLARITNNIVKQIETA